MGLFFLIVSLIFLTMHIIVGAWFYFIFPSIGWKISIVIFPLLGTALMCFAMTYTRTHWGTIDSLVYYITYIWSGLIFIFSFLVIILALMQALCALAHWHIFPLLKWGSLILFAAVTFLSIWGGFSQPKIKHINLSIPNAPHLTVTIISDTHLGIGVSQIRLQKALDRIQAVQPDLVLFLGDIFEYGPNREQYAQRIAQLSTPLGSYGVLGNHEYYVGLQNSIDFFKQAGIELLQNQFVTLPNGLQIIGINDIKTTALTAEQLDELLTKTDEHSPRILLSHQPLLTDIAAKHQIALMLSGHTHNGQIFPFNLLVKLVYPYIYGLYQIGPQSHLYVTSGMFYWGMPLRLFAPAEIPILHIN